MTRTDDPTTPPEPRAEPEGWWQALNMKRFHYFRAGRSLCGRWGKYGNAPFEDEAGLAGEPGPEDCVACWRKRAKELAR